MDVDLPPLALYSAQLLLAAAPSAPFGAPFGALVFGTRPALPFPLQ